MRTTVDLPEALLRQLKSQAAIEGTTLKQLVLRLVERGLKTPSEESRTPGKRSAPPTVALSEPLAIKQFSNAGLFELLDD
jgi:hypothetical protein